MVGNKLITSLRALSPPSRVSPTLEIRREDQNISVGDENNMKSLGGKEIIS